MKTKKDKPKIEGHLAVILKEMCRRVGADFDKIDFGKERWFEDYTWDEKQQEDFEKWLTDYLYKNKKATAELYSMHYPSKKWVKQAADMFILSYGWKCNYGVNSFGNSRA